MGRLLAGLGVAMGFAWLFRRRRKAAPPPAPAADPADELKRKLEEQRAAEPEPAPGPEPAAEEPERPLVERRDEVHRRARESIDRMKGEG